MPQEHHLLPYLEAGRLEAGCDEAGRGPLAGPVYAAAVILPPDFYHPLLNDSKQMSEKDRDMLRPIIEKEALAWVVEAVEAEEPIVQRTVELLNEVYNNENTGMRKHNCALRVRALCEEMDVFYHTLEEYTRNRQDRVTVRSLKALLSRRSRFAAFKRYYIRNHSNTFPELLPLVDR